MTAADMKNVRLWRKTSFPFSVGWKQNADRDNQNSRRDTHTHKTNLRSSKALHSQTTLQNTQKSTCTPHGVLGPELKPSSQLTVS